MRYAQIRRMDISNGDGIGVAIFTQGCPYHCKNCFNSEAWSYDGGKNWTDKEKDLILQLAKPTFIKRLSILGGEPLIERNFEPLEELFKEFKELYPEKKIWVYTGSVYENIKDICPELISYIDFLIDGPYIDEQRDLKLKFRGSANQRIIDVQQTLSKGEIICIRGN